MAGNNPTPLFTTNTISYTSLSLVKKEDTFYTGKDTVDGGHEHIEYLLSTTASALEGDLESVEKYLHSFPAGYRFAPRDDQLIEEYLIRSIQNRPLPVNNIKTINVYKHNPYDLAEMFKLHEDDEKEWYFFTSRDRKYRNGSRPNRAAGDGYWKATGADKDIISKKTSALIGHRKALVFYKGKPGKGIKSNWIMHEYRTPSSPSTTPKARLNVHDMRLDEVILCRIYEKTDRGIKAKANAGQDDGDAELGGGSVSPVSNNSEPVYDEDGITEMEGLILNEDIRMRLENEGWVDPMIDDWLQMEEPVLQGVEDCSQHETLESSPAKICQQNVDSHNNLTHQSMNDLKEYFNKVKPEDFCMDPHDNCVWPRFQPPPPPPPPAN
ncbi:hypothetical protein IFM89_017957 [Coptis chinensis]|uniref:NAC domain-containing protein n=1 Tax=Coptis chinensis TaxID=261450 RepID=A0A835HVQ2_9MAGN|nr:hypothetical protein IFM89_017957 [Coptis chinensis]